MLVLCSSSKAVAIGGVHLLAREAGSVLVERKIRMWKTKLTNFIRLPQPASFLNGGPLSDSVTLSELLSINRALVLTLRGALAANFAQALHHVCTLTSNLDAYSCTIATANTRRRCEYLHRGTKTAARPLHVVWGTTLIDVAGRS